MIDELKPIWKQSQETHAWLRKLLEDAPNERLHWKPEAEMWSVSDIVQHVDRGNRVYAMTMLGQDPIRPAPLENPNKAVLIEILNRSEAFVQERFEQVAQEDLLTARADDWCPLGLDVDGPLNGLWFALQIVRHAAYHAGQISYILQLPQCAVE